MAEENKENYVVLARKYRPQNFNELLGQDALVKTITNAIKNNRLHHAYILTGIRGVGKTTTARIIAKALNCTGKDASGGATVNPCGICENCKAIAESRHIDVLELDAASRTGIDDIREILDGVRYKPTNGRYKVYIIDEIHMLSKQAFNALLKTLEEPPSHVVFIFATTEIRKVPVTVLSRCQRFDLNRLTVDTLFNHFKNIIQKENLSAEDEALRMIARAADGSCRDGLSLLDQAISLGLGEVKSDVVKKMIGIADKGLTFELFESLVKGEMDDVIKNLENQHQNSANPSLVLQDLISITHMLAKVKIVPDAVNDPDLSEQERDFCKRVAPNVQIAILSKIWQMLIKGIGELNIAPSQADALEMILIRIAYSASLPTPAEILDGLKKNSSSQLNNVNPFDNQDKKALNILNTPEDMIALLLENRQILMAYSIKNDISFDEFKNGLAKIRIDDKIDNEFLMNWQKTLSKLTNTKWEIETSKAPLGETIADKEAKKDMEEKKDVLELPLVKAILEEFRGAKIDSLTRLNVDEPKETSFEESFEDTTYITEEDN